MKRLPIIFITLCLIGCSNAPTANAEIERLKTEYADVVFWINRFLQENKRSPSNEELPLEYRKRISRDRQKGVYRNGRSGCSLTFGSYSYLTGGFVIAWHSDNDSWEIQD